MDAFTAYYADAGKNTDREPGNSKNGSRWHADTVVDYDDVVFDQDLGLAVEKLREGMTTTQLWQLNTT